jgi:hypothetical protein
MAKWTRYGVMFSLKRCLVVLSEIIGQQQVRSSIRPATNWVDPAAFLPSFLPSFFPSFLPLLPKWLSLPLSILHFLRGRTRLITISQLGGAKRLTARLSKQSVSILNSVIFRRVNCGGQREDKYVLFGRLATLSAIEGACRDKKCHKDDSLHIRSVVERMTELCGNFVPSV